MGAGLSEGRQIVSRKGTVSNKDGENSFADVCPEGTKSTCHFSNML